MLTEGIMQGDVLTVSLNEFSVCVITQTNGWCMLYWVGFYAGEGYVYCPFVVWHAQNRHLF